MSTIDEARAARLRVQAQAERAKARKNTRHSTTRSQAQATKNATRPSVVGMVGGYAQKYISAMLGDTAQSRAQFIAGRPGTSARMQAALTNWAANKDKLLEQRIAKDRAARARRARSGR